MNIAPEAPVATARAQLRDACGEVHARLDARLSAFDFHDRSAYADMLSRMSGPLTATESALGAGIAPALLKDWPARVRSEALRADLAALGGGYRLQSAPAIDDEAAAFGALYVLEGSRLGGRVLARLAEESADAGVRAATQYFRHQEHAGHWRSFVEALEASEAVRRHPDRAERAALETFAAFEAAFA